MPIYEYDCTCGSRFEALVPRMAAPGPPCPACGAAPHRRPSAASLGGRADPGPGVAQAPRTWAETGYGDRETITYWRRALDDRRKLEEKYPELSGDRRPVIAHEGRYAAAPLRAGDPHLGHPHPGPQRSSPQTPGDSR